MPQAAERAKPEEPLPRTPALLRIAQRLVWWLAPEEALDAPIRFAAQVMALGTWNDIQEARSELGEGLFRAVLRDPPAGVFDERSWHYWHHVFGLWQVPPLPRRSIP